MQKKSLTVLSDDIAALRPTPDAKAPQIQNLAGIRVAVVHEWFISYHGSERVVEQILHCFPQADLFAIVDFMPEPQRAFIANHNITTSFIQRLPFSRRAFRHYLGLMPVAVEQFDLTSYDLVISSNHAVAKGVITGPDQLHISYVHSPMRYAWDLQHQYLRQSNIRGAKNAYVRWLFSRLRQWDSRTATSVDVFIANSTYIARRIHKVYRRKAEVIHPPVDLARFKLSRTKSDYYFVASRQVAYKRIDLIAAAFSEMPDRKLIIVGDGPEHQRVVDAAKSAPNIRVCSAVGRDELLRLMQSARGFIVAAEEDFGITMVEAQACGTPVISFGRGGSLDILDDSNHGGPTGVLFYEQSAPAIVKAIKQFESLSPPISAEACRTNAMRFSTEIFRDRLRTLVAKVMANQAEELDVTHSAYFRDFEGPTASSSHRKIAAV